MLLLVQALAQQPAGEFSLRLADGREFSVQFAADGPVAAEPLSRPELPPDSHPYIATLRFITV